MGWTGDEIVVVGGSTYRCPPTAGCTGPTEPPFRDGAAFDPATATWRSIADAPVPVPPRHPAASLGTSLYILVTPWASSEPSPPTLLQYRASDDSWRSYDVPSPVHGLAAAEAGLVAYPTSHERGETPDLWFDPSTGAWSELPKDPLGPSFDRLYAWNEDRLYLFAKAITPSPGGASGPALVNAAALEGGTWRELPTGQVLGFWGVITDGDRVVAPELGCADGGEVNSYGRCIPHGAVFDTETDTWTELPDAPSRGDEDVASSGAFTADEVLLTSLGHHMLDLTSDTWLEMPSIDDDDGAVVERTFAGVGPYGFAFGGARFDEDDFAGELLGDAWLWTPPRRDRPTR